MVLTSFLFVVFSQRPILFKEIEQLKGVGLHWLIALLGSLVLSCQALGQAGPLTRLEGQQLATHGIACSQAEFPQLAFTIAAQCWWSRSGFQCVTIVERLPEGWGNGFHDNAYFCGKHAERCQYGQIVSEESACLGNMFGSQQIHGISQPTKHQISFDCVRTRLPSNCSRQHERRYDGSARRFCACAVQHFYVIPVSRRLTLWPGGILGRFENVRTKKSAKKSVTCDVQS